PDHVLAAAERHRADLDREVRPAEVDDRERAVGHLRVPEQLARELLARPAGVLRRDDRGELPPDLIAHQPASRGGHPPDDALAVDRVARHVAVVERSLEICPHRLQRCDRHGPQVTCTTTGITAPPRSPWGQRTTPTTPRGVQNMNARSNDGRRTPWRRLV